MKGCLWFLLLCSVHALAETESSGVLPWLALSSPAYSFSSPPLDHATAEADAADDVTVDPFLDYPSLGDLYVPYRRPGYVERGVNYLLDSRESVSSAVVIMGSKMDRYFAGEKYLDVENDTYLRLRIAEKWLEAGRLQPEFDYKFRLDLPGTKERYRLVLLFDEDNEQGLEERNRPSAAAVPTNDQSLFAGLLRTITDEGGEWETKLSAGIKVRLPPDPFARVAAKRFVPLNEDWTFEVRSSMEWFHSSGFHGNLDFEFERLLADDYLFRATTLFDWREELDTLEFGQTFQIFHDLSERDAIVYQVGTFGTSLTYPRINTYYISADYRRRLYKDWFYMNIIPEQAFPREEEFDGVSSITLSFEIYFR